MARLEPFILNISLFLIAGVGDNVILGSGLVIYSTI